MKKASLFAIFCLLSIVSYPQSTEADLGSLDAYIEQARRDWKVPGLAVAIVKDGEVLHAKGYGVRSLKTGEPVTEETLFAMASTTKAMTAAALAMLVDEGKVDWDDPVVKHLPQFRLEDPYITSDLRVRDLLTHNTGIGNADFLWWKTDLSSEEILDRMQYAETAYPLRGGYTYQNIMYLAAGELIGRVSGMPWDEFIFKRIMVPLNMSRSTPLRRLAEEKENRSTPHDYVNDEIQPIVNTNADRIGPAGSGWSCVADMARWMNFLLDSARVDDTRLISAENFSELFSPQIVIPKNQFYPTSQLTQPFWTTYALGWFQHDYREHAVSFHTGSLGGTVAICGLLPEQRLGVYVFGNLDHTELRHAIMYKVFDTFTGRTDGRDWSAEFLNLYHDLHAKSETAQEEKWAKRKKGTSRSLPLKAYTGTYQDPFYGTVEVALVENQLHARLSAGLQVTLRHWHFDTFRGSFNLAWLEDDLFSFELNENGEVSVFRRRDISWKKLDEEKEK